MNIFLIGYRGTGKTVTGRILAGMLELEFVDLDDEIEKSSGKTIADIFSAGGEEKFREMEKEALAARAAGKRQVIATGGGIVLFKENVSLMQDRGIIVHLQCDPGLAAERIEADPNTASRRPGLSDTDLRSEVRAQMRTREPLYREAADSSIDTGRMNPEEVSEDIIRKLAVEGGFEHKAEPKHSVTSFEEITRLGPVKLPKNTRVRTENEGMIYKINSVFFCDACASSSSVLVRLEGTDRLRCVICKEWIEVGRVADSGYEFYLPVRWKEEERKKWYETWKLKRSVHIETRRLIKDYLGALKLPEEDEEITDVESGPEEDADRILSPEMASYYVRVLDGEEQQEPHNQQPARSATGTEIVDLTPAHPFDPSGISVQPETKNRQDESEIIDLTPAQPFDPASIGAQPQGSPDESEIINLTPTQPFDPASIGATPEDIRRFQQKSTSGGQEGKKQTKVVFPDKPAGAAAPSAPAAPEQPPPQQRQPGREEKLTPGGKGKTRIVWDSANKPEEPQTPDAPPPPIEPAAEDKKPEGKKSRHQTRIVFTDQTRQEQDADEDRKGKQQPPPPPA
ncbi:MAG: shikimate kinase [Planctomycetota bacterium]|jgi:shikimate kinase